MIIAVSIEKPDLNSSVSSSFGRSNYFALFDTLKNSREIFANPYVDTFGGAGIQSAQLMIEKNAEIVITEKIGLNAFRLLESADIKIYLCTGKNAEEAVKFFLDEKPEPAKLPDTIPRKRKRKRIGGRNKTNPIINHNRIEEET